MPHLARKMEHAETAATTAAPVLKAAASPNSKTRPLTAPRPRRVEVHPFPSNRHLVTAALRAGRHKTPMYGFLDVDVTLAKRLLAAADPPASMTAFIAASLARVAADHPEVHAYRDWRGRLVTHQFVDVSTMVEIATAQGPFAIPHSLRDADIRSVEVRDVLNLTLAIDHDVIDGAPAARFGAELREVLETAAVLTKPAANQPRAGDRP
jgi:pyruvate/2-oxoglutarate dehydrogenase complex dihydrolipoamide acyltransferase (E2) component